MQVMFEEYGELVIAVIGGAITLAILISAISPDGALNQYIQDFLGSAC